MAHEPTGETESFWGNLDPRTFGYRDHREPAALDPPEEANYDGMGGLYAWVIDPNWLQRKISWAFFDHHNIDPQLLAEEVQENLADGDDREVENKLFVHLGIEKFGLIEYLLLNRVKIVWCTRLARAKGDEEKRKEIEEEIRGLGSNHVAILEEFRATSKERLKIVEGKIREEARQLREGWNGESKRELK